MQRALDLDQSAAPAERLSDAHDRATRLNLLASLGNFALSGLIGLIVNPLLLGTLGAGSFGAWKACQRLVELVMAGDGGPPQALKWMLAQQDASTALRKQRTLTAGFLVWLQWLPAMALVALCVVFVLPLLVEGEKLGLVAALLCLNAAVIGLAAIPAAALIGANQSRHALAVTTLGLVASNILLVLAATGGYDLPTLAALALAISVASGLSMLFVARWRIEWIGLAKPLRAYMISVRRFSTTLLSWTFVQRLLLTSEILLLSALVGVGAVTQYVFTSFIAQFVLALCLLATGVFMPRLGMALSRGDQVEARRIICFTRESALAIVAVSGTLILALNPHFVQLWGGGAVYMGDAVNLLIVIAVAQVAHIRWSAQIQDASLADNQRGRVAIAATVSSLVIATAAWLIFGSTLSLFIGLVVGRLLLTLAFAKLLRQSLPRDLIDQAESRPVAIVFVMCALAYACGRLVAPDDFLSLAFAAIAGGALLAVATFYLILTPSSRDMLLVLLNGRGGVGA